MGVHEEVQAALDRATAGGEEALPGVSFMALDRQGNVITQNVSGTIGKNSDEKMSIDTVFWMASCTKVIAGFACLQLVEQGKIGLDDPLDDIVPALKGRTIVSNGQVSKAKNSITLKMLLTHTAGFSYSFFSEDISKWADEGGKDEFCGSFAGIDQPLLFEPGSRFQYGVNIDWAGIVLEKITGLTLGEYCQKHIFEPLGVRDATFDLSKRPDMLKRLAKMNQRNTEGTQVTQRDHLMPESVSFDSGGAGLFCTVPDYLKLIAPLIRKGTGFNGAQILKPETVKLAFENHIAHLDKSTAGLDQPVPVPAARAHLANAAPKYPDLGENGERGWGLTFLKTEAPLPTGRSANSVWWAGLVNLFWASDPSKGVVELIASQILPFGEMRVLGAWMEAEAAVYKSLS